MNNYIVHIQHEDGSFSSLEVTAETVYKVMEEFPNAYLIDENLSTRQEMNGTN